MADDVLQAESACANPDGRSIARTACDDFDGIGVFIEQAAALVNVIADATTIDSRCRNALCSVSDLLDFRAGAVREIVNEYLAASRPADRAAQESAGAQADPGAVAWKTGRDFETLAGQLEDAAALVDLLATADSIDQQPRNALGAVSDLISFIRTLVSESQTKFDAIAETDGGKVAKFTRGPLH